MSMSDSLPRSVVTLTFTLSNPNPSRVKLADAEAVGTTTNDDAIPKAWIARFRRTVADQVLDAVQGRMGPGGSRERRWASGAGGSGGCSAAAAALRRGRPVPRRRPATPGRSARTAAWRRG